MSKRRKKKQSDSGDSNLISPSKFQEEVFACFSVFDLLEYASDEENKAGSFCKMWENNKIPIKEKVCEMIRRTKSYNRNLKHPFLRCLSSVDSGEIRLIFQKYFPEENHQENNLKDIKWGLFDRFYGNPTDFDKRRMEIANIESFDGNFGYNFVTICSQLIPHEIIEKIMEFIKRNHENLLNVGGVCQSFYMVMLSTWSEITIRASKLRKLSIFALRNCKKIVIKTIDIKELKKVLKKVNPMLEVLAFRTNHSKVEKDTFNAIRSEKIVFKNVKELISSFPNNWSYRGVNGHTDNNDDDYYGGNAIKKSFDYKKHFPSLRSIKYCHNIFDDTRFRDISKNLRKITFNSSRFFSIVDAKEKSSIDPSNPYYGSERVFLEDDGRKYTSQAIKNRILERSPFILNHPECNYCNVSQIHFSSLKMLYHPESIFGETDLDGMWRNFPLYKPIKRKMKCLDLEKEPLIIDLFPNLEEIYITLYSSWFMFKHEKKCHCKKNILMSLERILKRSKVFKKFVLNCKYGGNYGREKNIHFCNDFEYPRGLEIKELHLFSSCIDSEHYNLRGLNSVIVDLNVQDLLNKLFFSNNTIQIFRGKLPFLKGVNSDVNSNTMILVEVGDEFIPVVKEEYESLDEVIETSLDFVNFLKNQLKDFQVFDLIVQTRNSYFEKEKIHIKYEKKFQTTIGREKRLFFSFKQVQEQSEEDIFGGGRKIREEDFLSLYSPFGKEERRKWLEKEKKALKIVTVMFIWEVVEYLAKQKIVDEISLNLEGENLKKFVREKFNESSVFDISVEYGEIRLIVK